ncbi:hypothetical protein D3C80_1732530 [compost metagenome]
MNQNHPWLAQSQPWRRLFLEFVLQEAEQLLPAKADQFEALVVARKEGCDDVLIQFFTRAVA